MKSYITASSQTLILTVSKRHNSNDKKVIPILWRLRVRKGTTFFFCLLKAVLWLPTSCGS